MLTTPVTVVSVAGGGAGPSASASAVTARARRDGDDDAPLLIRAANGRPTSPSTGVGSSSAGAPSWPRWLRQARPAAWVVSACSFSGGVTWIVKGLCICMGMMLMGGVGSFTLHQMMSPQIESLLLQRNELQQDLADMQNQVDNMTRIAESRLEMIHLLEKELERQAVEAAAAAAATDPGNARDPMLGNAHRFGSHKVHGAFFWPTVLYAWTLGALVLLAVGYRVYRISQDETRRLQKMRSHQYPENRNHRSATTTSTVSSMHSTIDMAGALGDMDLDADYEGGLLAGVGAPASASSSRAVLSPRCYKRAPGNNSPTDRLMHV